MSQNTPQIHLKPYYLGIGCRRGVTYDEMEQFISSILHKQQIKWNTIHTIASCTLKSDEPALIKLAKEHNIPLHFYSTAELKQVNVPTPSKTVSQKIGSPSVSEAAALLISSGELILPKQKTDRITVAIAKKR